MSFALRHRRLHERAALLGRLRGFFVARGFLEIETPLLDDELIPELHIEPFAVADGARTLWLQASPELPMKRLLAEGLPAIFQATRSFRRGEQGRHHNREFTIVEWYRAGDDYAAGIALLAELIGELTRLPATQITYREAFLRYAAVDPFTATPAELQAVAVQHGIAFDDDDDPPPPADSRQPTADSLPFDELLNLLLAKLVEPHLGAQCPHILLDYPASQAALARTAVRDDGVEVAERFELYWRGVELANGYHELIDPTLLRQRLTEVNEQRRRDGRVAPPLPERLLAVMESPGLPPCAGCALGFDRLAMLVAGASEVGDVMVFASE